MSNTAANKRIQKVLLVLGVMIIALLMPQKAWADWAASHFQSSVAVTERLSASAQHIKLKLPVCCHPGLYSDGVYRTTVKIGTGGAGSANVTLLDAPTCWGTATHRTADYYCFSSTSREGDYTYRYLTICLKENMTWQEYHNLYISVYCELWIDETKDNASRPSGSDLVTYTKNFSYSDLSSADLALPTYTIPKMLYSTSQTTVQLQPSISNGWRAQFKFATSASGTTQEAQDNGGELRYANIQPGIDKYDTSKHIYVWPVARQSFTVGGHSFTRSIVANSYSQHKIYQKKVTDLAMQMVEDGIKLTWKLSDGIEGGKIIVKLQGNGQSSATQIVELDDCTTCTLTKENLTGYSDGTITVLHKSIYDDNDSQASSASVQYTAKDLPMLVKVGDWYEIYNPYQLRQFITTDNGSNARLMNDIEMPEGMTLSSGINAFNATFDGQGHCISGLVISSSNSIAALVTNLDGTIQNLGICYSKFIDKYYTSAFAFAIKDAGKVTNCYAYGNTLSGSYKYVFAYSNNSNAITNCWTTDEYEISSNDLTSNAGNDYKLSPDDPILASGELCYKLNNGGDNGWRQNLGSDPYPVPDNSHKQVFLTTPCAAYANGDPNKAHQWVVVQTVAPTCFTEGYTIQQCSVCKEEQKTDIVEAHGHHHYADGKCTYCNDDAPLKMLCFTAEEDDASVMLHRNGSHGNISMIYSFDGTDWYKLAINTDISLAHKGDKLYISAADQNGALLIDRGNYHRFALNKRIACTGDVTALLDKRGTTTVPECAFFCLFQDCTTLTTAPTLPATTLARCCYDGMFMGCTSLTTAPVLPATTLAESCYKDMFYNCSSLTTAPALPATTLAESCYNSMFYNCTSLTIAPALPATTLAVYCYSLMFFSCTSLTTAPTLPATILANFCYDGMFENCTSLTTAPVLPATTLAESCYNSMFLNCTSLTTAPVLPATTLAKDCYDYMFNACTSLSSVTVGFESTDAFAYTSDWLSDVAPNGTFYCLETLANADDLPRGADGIPENWTIKVVSSIYSQGDLNKDGRISIADVTLLINAIQNGETTSEMDLNDDDTVNEQDIQSLVELVKGNGR